jgi:hypothetical protein
MADDIRVELYDVDADADAVDRESHQLREELLSIDAIDGVSPASAGPAPPGSRAVDIPAIGAFIVSAEPTLTLVTHVVAVVRRWLQSGLHSGHQQRTLRLTVNGQSLELSAATADQQQAVVDQFLRTVSAT